MQGTTKKLLLTTILAGLSVFVPLSFNSANAITTTTCEAGSCAPKCSWECIHGDVIRPDRCDPNDTGCLGSSLEAEGCDEVGEVPT